MLPTDLESFLFAKIPIARALGVRVLKADTARAEIAAELNPNLNHLGTAFGGSLNAVLVLACYSWLFNLLDENGIAGHVVLKSSECRYLHPVDGDFTAICLAPAAGEADRFLKTMQKKRRAQIELMAAIHVAGALACELHGKFVALPG